MRCQLVTGKVYFYLSLRSKLRMQMLESLSSKVHDEERQGEAYSSGVMDDRGFRKKFYIESYGCQMNFSDFTSSNPAPLGFRLKAKMPLLRAP